MKLVLSVSGGGIRGLIPAMILAEIEKRTHQPIAASFDLIAGTSTGGIIAALLTTPHAGSRHPQYSADQVVDLYKQFGKRVFHQTAVRKLATMDGLLATKYPAKPLEGFMRHYLGETKLSDTLTNLLIPAYQISGKPYPHFFKTYNARGSKSRLDNPYLWECVRATSAANSYFTPYRLDETHTFLDGGLFANSPAMCAYAQAKNTYGEKEKIGIFSIGTGEDLIGYPYEEIRNWGMLEWAISFFRQTSISADATVDYMLRAFTKNGDPYLRLQTALEENALRMDDASDRNLARLERAATKTIHDHEAVLEEIVRLIHLHTSGCL